MDVEVKNKANRRHVGHNLQKIRVYFGMKQEALAADLGVNQQVISKIEKQEEIEEGLLTYIIHSGFISGYQNRYGDNLKPPTNVYHRMTA